MAKELSDDQIRHILQGIKVPPQPQILVDIQMEQVMPDPDIDRIAELISQDVSLAGTILKFVNSPFVGLSNRITSIRQAVALLSLDSVVNIINGISIKGELSDQTIVELTGFWDTANDISRVAFNIAKRIGMPAADEAYALGLFHNCGIPLMMDRFPNYLDGLAKAYAEPLKRITETENELFNTNHSVIGYYVARSWNLPAEICEAIAEHHSIERSLRSPSHKVAHKLTLMAILKISEHLCGTHITFGRQSRNHEWDRVGESVLEYVGLTPYDIEDMRSSFHELGIDVVESYQPD